MKIALLACLGLFLGTLGGAALGIGAGLAWVEWFKIPNLQGHSGTLVVFTFMPSGGALLFGLLAMRDAAIAIEQQPVVQRER